MDKLLDITECAEYLGIPKDMVYRLVQKRLIPFYRLGKVKHIRFDPSEIKEWLKTRDISAPRS